MFKKIALAAALFAAAGAQAAQTVSYGWEDGVGTVLSQFGSGMVYKNLATGAAYSGNNVLTVEDLSNTSGTPQGYLAWIQGLTDGDTVDASFWAFDDTPGTAAPSVRIWGHYTDDNNDVDSYAGSAGGNNTYSGASLWSELTHSWVFDSDGGSRDGLMVEVRFYDSAAVPTGIALVDDLTVTTSSDTATIITPAPVPVPAAAWLFASAAAGLAAFRRRRAA